MYDRDEALHGLAYDDWALLRVEESLRRASPLPPAASKLFAHLIASREAWLERIEGVVVQPGKWWPDWTLEECARHRAATAIRWRDWAARLDAAELQREVVFTNSAGAECHDPIEAILRHVVNHSTHHRGQIASALRAAGCTPPQTDYIVWRREKQRAP